MTGEQAEAERLLAARSAELREMRSWSSPALAAAALDRAADRLRGPLMQPDGTPVPEDALREEAQRQAHDHYVCLSAEVRELQAHVARLTARGDRGPR